MPCYYIILIVPAAIVTLTASGVVRDLGREQDARYIVMLITGFGFPGWVLGIYVGLNFVLALVGVEGYSWNLHTSDMTAPFYIAISAGLSGVLTSIVFGWALRSWLIFACLGSVSIATAALCLLSPDAATIPPGLIAGAVLWVGMAVATLRLWSTLQQSSVRRNGAGAHHPPPESPDELSTL